jgi:hypothetical protein
MFILAKKDDLSKSTINFLVIIIMSLLHVMLIMSSLCKDDRFEHSLCRMSESLILPVSRGRILGRNWDTSLKIFPPCYSQSPLLMDLTPPPPSQQKWFETGVCNVSIVKGNQTSENSQDYPRNLNDIVRS